MEKNWDDLTVFFQFPLEIRKIIYTTNLIENLNGKIRKYTKSKFSFPSDDAVKKTVYLSLMEIEKKWTQPIHNWGLIMNQFMLIFENRIQIIRKNLQLNPISNYTKFWTVPILYIYRMLTGIWSDYYISFSHIIIFFRDIYWINVKT